MSGICPSTGRHRRSKVLTTAQVEVIHIMWVRPIMVIPGNGLIFIEPILGVRVLECVVIVMITGRSEGFVFSVCYKNRTGEQRALVS